MAKLSSIEKNKRRRRMVKKYSGQRAKLKAIVMNKSLTIEERFTATLKLAKLPRNGARNRIRNRCQMTGRSRAYYRKLGLSRIALRELANQGMIPGMVKSSW